MTFHACSVNTCGLYFLGDPVKTIYLSAGHSNADPGVVRTAVKNRDGKVVAAERREADIAVEFRNMVSLYLFRAGIKHDTDGKGTENYPLNRAATVARKHDIAVEFHCNSGPATATGAETLSAPRTMALAAQLSRAVSSGLNIRDRGAKPENAGQHSRLAFVQAGGIIVELFFLTNTDDLRAYDERKWLAARNVAEVLIGAAK